MAIVSTTTYQYVDANLNPYFIQGAALVDRGAWSSSAFYTLKNVVQISGGQYVAIAANSGAPPSSIVDKSWSTLIVFEQEGSAGYYSKNGGQIFGTTGVGINCPPNVKALLDISSSLKGSRPWPPMTQAARESLTAGLALGTEDIGLAVYQTDGERGVWHWQGAAWIPPSVVYCEGHWYARTATMKPWGIEEATDKDNPII